MTWKTPYAQELAEIAGQRPRYRCTGLCVLVLAGSLWFGLIAAGLWLAHFL